jgi:hypothetical protein
VCECENLCVKKVESQRGAKGMSLSREKKRNKTKHFIIFFSPRARVLYILKKQHAKNENKKKKNNTTLRHIISTTRRHNGSFKTENDRHV